VRRQQQGIRQQITADALTALTDRQLGELDAPTPGLANLRKRLGTFTQAFKGTFLDTSATEAQLKRFRKVLAEGLVPDEVRQKFAGLLSDLEQQLKDHTGKQTKTTSLSADRILAGIGLSQNEQRALTARLSHFNSAGVALAGAGAPIVVHTTSNLIVDGKVMATTTTKHQQKTDRRNPPQKRGGRVGP
jgi:hypothetical protein